MDVNHIILNILMAGIPLIFAITIHEAAHAYVAKWRGDTTAYVLGRTTLSPVSHIDPIGTILVPALMLLSGTSFIFGWAKSVPINYNNLKKPKLDMALVAVAGPLVNLIMAIIWALVLKFGTDTHPYIQGMAVYGISINIVLLVLNMLPIPPLDGSRIVTALLPNDLAYKYNTIERYGFFILIAFIFIPYQNGSLLSFIMSPFITFFYKLITAIIL